MFSADEPVPVTYAEYLDLAKASTLVAEPGETYDIEPAAGAPDGLPMPPDDRWSAPAAPRAKTSKETS
jgi:hypothetical protein